MNKSTYTYVYKEMLKSKLPDSFPVPTWFPTEAIIFLEAKALKAR